MFCRRKHWPPLGEFTGRGWRQEGLWKASLEVRKAGWGLRILGSGLDEDLFTGGEFPPGGPEAYVQVITHTRQMLCAKQLLALLPGETGPRQKVYYRAAAAAAGSLPPSPAPHHTPPTQTHSPACALTGRHLHCSVCAWGGVHVYVHVCADAHVWRPEGNLGCPSLGLYPFA